MPVCRPLLALLAAAAVAAAALAGCGAPSDTEQPQRDVPGGGGDEVLSATDVADVESALRIVEDACPSGSDSGRRLSVEPAQLGGAVRTLHTISLRSPASTFESGNAPQRQRMDALADTVAQRLRRCGRPREARLLQRPA